MTRLIELDEQIRHFLDGAPHAVVGASRSREKYGNKVLRSYQQGARAVYPVNPTTDQIEGLEAYPDLESLPQSPHGVSVITPPQVTSRIVEDAVRLGIRHLWLQPGAESDEAIRLAEQHGLNLIAGGPCILVTLRFRDV
jgi:predicted CoA-binding protein